MDWTKVSCGFNLPVLSSTRLVAKAVSPKPATWPLNNQNFEQFMDRRLKTMTCSRWRPESLSSVEVYPAMKSEAGSRAVLSRLPVSWTGPDDAIAAGVSSRQARTARATALALARKDMSYLPIAPV